MSLNSNAGPIPPSQLISSGSFDPSVTSDQIDAYAQSLLQHALASVQTDVILSDLEQVVVCVEQIDQLVSEAESRLQKVESTQPGFLSLPSTKDKWQAQVVQAREQLHRVNDQRTHIHEVREEVINHLQNGAVQGALINLQAQTKAVDFAQGEIARQAHLKFLDEKRSGKGRERDDEDEDDQSQQQERSGARRMGLNIRR